LMAGRNPHAIGLGSHALTAMGFPGYNAIVPPTAKSVANYLEEAGYSDYKAENMRQFLVDHAMPASLDDIGISADQFLDYVNHALDIMNRRNRYSVLQHQGADDTQILKTLKVLKYL